MSTLHEYERYLCNNFMKFTKEIAGKEIPRATGIYMLGVEINKQVMPVYLGRACGDTQTLWLRSRRYIRVLYGHRGQGEVIDYLLRGINIPEEWYISWVECSAEIARELEKSILRNTVLKLVNVKGMNLGNKQRAKENADWYMELYSKLS